MKEDKPELVFTDLPEGRKFRTLEYPITEELIRDYMEVVGDWNPLYLDETAARNTSLGSPIAPPGLAAIYARLSYLQDYTMPSGGVLAKQEFEFIRPFRAGDILHVNAKVIESFLDKKERKRVTFLIDAANQHGEPVSSIRLYAIWPK